LAAHRRFIIPALKFRSADRVNDAAMHRAVTTHRALSAKLEGLIALAAFMELASPGAM